MKEITVLVVGDEVIPRAGLKHLLASEDGFDVRGEANSTSAIEEAAKLAPDVIITFAEATRPSCAQMISSLRAAVPDSGIVVLGRETHHAYVALLLSTGALGYVLVRASPRDLFSAIRVASCGRRFIDPILSDELYAMFAHQAETGTKVLSRREEQVLRMLAYGHTLKEIAGLLNVSRKSIETYQARSRQKLGLRTRADIVRYARETGIFSPDSLQKV
jgi:two-component system response regulator NreC